MGGGLSRVEAGEGAWQQSVLWNQSVKGARYCCILVVCIRYAVHWPPGFLTYLARASLLSTKPQVAAALGYVPPSAAAPGTPTDGCFWMSWPDFTRHFHNLIFCCA